MATLSSSSPALTTPLASSAISGQRKAVPSKVRFVTGLNSFAGLKANNGVVSLGVPVTAEQSFAKLASSLRSSGGGATCNAVGEIFKIAAIMNGLVLVGVAVGFVLLRMEALVEESEA